VRTTIRLDDDLLRDAKRRALDRGITLTQLIEDALRVELARRPAPPHERIELTTFKGSGTYPDVDLDDGAALRDLMDGY
jgi:hypothetical protein